MPVRYWVNPQFLPTGGVQTVDASFQTWSNAGGIRFANAGSTATSASRRDGSNVLAWVSSSWAYGSGTLGVTQTTTDWYGRIIEADIQFNARDYKWQNRRTTSSWTWGVQYVADIATHEIGHFLGLGHTNDSTATMYPTAMPGIDTLAQDDVNGVRFLYGAPSSTTSTTPPPSSTPTTTTRIYTTGPQSISSAGEVDYFRFDAPSATTKIVFRLSGATADLDIYAKKGAYPTGSGDDVTGNSDQWNETASIEGSLGGAWYVAVVGYNGATSPYELKIEVTTTP